MAIREITDEEIAEAKRLSAERGFAPIATTEPFEAVLGYVGLECLDVLKKDSNAMPTPFQIRLLSGGKVIVVKTYSTLAEAQQDYPDAFLAWAFKTQSESFMKSY